MAATEKPVEKTEFFRQQLIEWISDRIRKAYNKKSKEPNSHTLAAADIVDRLVKERANFEFEGDDQNVLIVKFTGKALMQTDTLARTFAAEIKNTYGIRADDTTGTIRTKLVLLGVSYLQALNDARHTQEQQIDAAIKRSRTANGDAGEKAGVPLESKKTGSRKRQAANATTAKNG